MIVYHSDHFVLPLPEGHRFPMHKYRQLRERLAVQWPQIVWQEAPAATDADLARVHTAAYIEAITRGTASAVQMREIGFPWSEAMVARARRSVGGTVAACRTALQRGVSASTAGGTHHAHADKGGGFCVFNDVAVAVRVLQAERAASGRRLPVAVIDLDVHQGNGTADIFRDDPSVFTLSLHGEKNFPFRKAASDLDRALPDGCNDAAYLEALDLALDELAARFASELVVYLAGADPHEGDRLGRLKLTYDGLEARDRRVFDWAWQRRLPLAFVMAGGYGHDIATTLQAQLNTYRVALEHAARWHNAPP